MKMTKAVFGNSKNGPQGDISIWTIWPLYSKAASNIEELEFNITGPSAIHLSAHADYLRARPLCSFSLRQTGGSIEMQSFIPDEPKPLYKPQSAEEAMYDIANGCHQLERICSSSHIGHLFHGRDRAATIIRDGPGGPVKDLRISKGWGRLIGREDSQKSSGLTRLKCSMKIFFSQFLYNYL